MAAVSGLLKRHHLQEEADILRAAADQARGRQRQDISCQVTLGSLQLDSHLGATSTVLLAAQAPSGARARFAGPLLQLQVLSVCAWHRCTLGLTALELPGKISAA